MKKAIIVLTAVGVLFLLFSSCVKSNKSEIVLIPPVNIYPLQTEYINSNNFYARWTKSVSNEDSAVTYSVSYSRSIEDLAESFAYETKHNYFLLPHLESGVWYWRVKAQLNDKIVNSPIWSFTIASDGLPVPKDPQKTPIDPLLIVSEIGDNGFNLDWNDYIDPLYPSNEISYTIKLYEDNGQILHRKELNSHQMITFLSRSDPITTIITTNTNHWLENLKANTCYIWTLIAGADASRTTALGNGLVRTGNGFPTPPELLYPSHNATEVVTDVILDWTESTDPDGDDLSYFVYIDTYPNPTQSETMNGTQQTTFQPKGLKAGRTYYWFILVKDIHGAATRTQTRQFKTKSLGGINVPKDPTPKDGEEKIDALCPQLLEWGHDKNNKSVAYTVYLSSNPKLMEQQAELITNKYYEIPGILKSNTQYYWQVEAVDVQTGHSAYSDMWTFKTSEIDPPLQTDAQTNLDGTGIELTYDKLMKDPKDKHTQYIVKRKTVADQEAKKEEILSTTDIIMSPNATNIYILSIESPLLHNEMITIDYIQGNVQAQDGSFLENYRNKVVVNTVPGDAPTVIAATAASDRVTLRFDKPMAIPPDNAATQFIVTINGSPKQIETITHTASDTYCLQLNANNVAYEDVVIIEYNKGTIQAQDGAYLESFSRLEASNLSDPIKPLFINGKTTEDGKTVIITFDKPMADPNGKHSQFTINVKGEQINEKREQYSFIQATLNKDNTRVIELTLNNPVSNEQSLTLNYTSGNIQCEQGATLSSFTNQPITNKVPATDPICTGATMTADGKRVKIGFNQEMEIPTQLEANQFGILVNGYVNEIESANLDEDKHIIILTLDNPIGNNNHVHLSYMKGTVSSVNEGLLESFQNKRVNTDKIDNYWVTKGCGWNYSSIQDAVDAARNGDSITVSLGVYEENLTINNKNIHITSVDPTSESVRQKTVIDAGANGNPGIRIIETDTKNSKRSEASTIIEGLTITNASGTSNQSNPRSPTTTSGIVIIGASPILRHNIICGNKTDYYGGGILIKNISFGSEQRPSIEKNQPQIYNNTIENNSAEKGGGIYVDANSLVLNADGSPWKWFNAPESSEEYVEGNTDELLSNIYQNNSLLESLDSRDTVSDGANICFAQIDTPEGTLTLRPETAMEQSNVTLHIDYLIGTSFHGGSLTIQVPDEFSIGNSASVTIGDETKLSDEYSPEATTITITGINLGEGTITVKLEGKEVPTGLSSQRGERNVSYEFKALSDADGPGNAWGPSGDSSAWFTSLPLSINTDFSLNDSSPQLIQIEITDTATTIKVASGTTVEEVLSNIESTDGSKQEYRIYDSGMDSMEGLTELTEIATLVVVSERGKSYKTEYAIVINPTPFIKLNSASDEHSLKRLNRPESNYSETWHNTIASAVASGSNTEPSVITVWPATYLEEQMEIIGKQLNIKSADTDTFTIDLEGKGCRAFNIMTNASVTIQNAIIQNGQPTDEQGGGAIRVDNSKLHIENATITNNITPLDGGALSVENDSVLTMIECSVVNNKAKKVDTQDQKGGGIFLAYSNFYATSTRIQNNEAGRNGGGLYLSGNGECVLENCTITNNISLSSGGGLYISGSSQVFQFKGEKVSVTTNQADQKGGGMLITGNSTFSFVESVFENNIATKSGGGIYAASTGTINGCTITSNQAFTINGGGIYVDGDHLTLNDSTIIENFAGQFGGGLFYYYSEGTINETIIRTNVAHEGSGVYLQTSTPVLTDNINWGNDIGSQTENIGISPKDSTNGGFETSVVYKDNILSDYSVVITDNSTITGNNQLHIVQ